MLRFGQASVLRVGYLAMMGRCWAAGLAAAALVVGCAGEPTVEQQSAVGSPPAATAAPSYFVYEVKPRDTLFSLGERFGVPWEEIRDANRLGRPEDLNVGAPLLIRRVPGVPVPELSATPPAEYRSPERRRVLESDLHRGKPSARFWWPTYGRLVRKYGDRLRGLSESGIGILTAPHTEVYAVADGRVVTVLEAGQSGGPSWGDVVAIAHSDDMTSWYAQLDQVMVKKGQQVAKGEPLGTVGAGPAGRNELAFRLYRNERPVNPEDYLP